MWHGPDQISPSGGSRDVQSSNLDREDLSWGLCEQALGQYCFLALGFVHGVRGEFTDDVSEIAVGPVFTGHE
jgi:hypothetical protein